MLKKLLVATLMAYSIHSVQAQTFTTPRGEFLGCAATYSSCQALAAHAGWRYSFLGNAISCRIGYACYGSFVDPRILGGGQSLKK